MVYHMRRKLFLELKQQLMYKVKTLSVTIPSLDVTQELQAVSGFSYVTA